jgi:molybdopterin molybdotransferase
MLTVKQAQDKILKSIKILPPENVKLEQALLRVLAEDIRSRIDIPAFDNSAMDGYALQAKDALAATMLNPKVLEVIGDIKAGDVFQKKITKGKAVRIMTGGVMPAGADAVIMVEYTQKIKNGKGVPERVKIFREVSKGENVRKRGEDVKKGELVLKKGSFIRAQELGMLASLGCKEVKVYRRPRVGILATGDELVGIDEKVKLGKVRDSNSWSLRGQVLSLGAEPVCLGIARDKRHLIRKKIKKGLEKGIDILLVSAGISVGDYDLVKDVLKELGLRMNFWKVAMRPGKPNAFGFINNVPVFGLPGNPVSSMISFEQFVRPAILKMMGAKEIFRKELIAYLEEDIMKKKGFRYFLRGTLKVKGGKFYVRTTGPQGSGILKSMVKANAIIILSEERTKFKKGEQVKIWPL